MHSRRWDMSACSTSFEELVWECLRISARQLTLMSDLCALASMRAWDKARRDARAE